MNLYSKLFWFYNELRFDDSTNEKKEQHWFKRTAPIWPRRNIIWYSTSFCCCYFLFIFILFIDMIISKFSLKSRTFLSKLEIFSCTFFPYFKSNNFKDYDFLFLLKGETCLCDARLKKYLTKSCRVSWMFY